MVAMIKAKIQTKGEVARYKARIQLRSVSLVILLAASMKGVVRGKAVRN